MHVGNESRTPQVLNVLMKLDEWMKYETLLPSAALLSKARCFPQNPVLLAAPGNFMPPRAAVGAMWRIQTEITVRKCGDVMAETNCVECGRLHDTYNAATIQYMKFCECRRETRDVQQGNQL